MVTKYTFTCVVTQLSPVLSLAINSYHLIENNFSDSQSGGGGSELEPMAVAMNFVANCWSYL